MSNHVGWLKLHRELFDKPIWLKSTPEQKTILIAIMSMVNHEAFEWDWQGKKFLCMPGQCVTSLQGIVDRCGKGITIQNVRTALVRFKKLEFLTVEPTKTGSVITVLNWAFYQSDEA